MKLEIKNNSQKGRETEVFLDGINISKFCQKAEIKIDVHEANQAQITFIPTAIEFDGEVAIYANIGNAKYKLVEDEK